MSTGIIPPIHRLPFSRIIKVLEYIHQHLDQPLSVEQLAAESCWSRWQLQRVFLHETGSSVANYVREIKLSRAAELLISSDCRVIDIALALGFNSEISFSRAFKNRYRLSPREYKKRGVLTGLREPLEVTKIRNPLQQGSSLIEVRIETREAFQLNGIHADINGVLSSAPNFQQRVPRLWQQFNQLLAQAGEAIPVNVNRPISNLGVIDTTQISSEGASLCYWAGMSTFEVEPSGMEAQPLLPSLASLFVPKQTYAVVKHHGPVQQLAMTVEWFLLDWLPDSRYRGLDGYELEIYPAQYDGLAEQACMEYWLPVAPKGNA